MMTLQGFLKLAVQTVTAPRDVARLLLSIRPGQEALLTAFALVVVLNALAFALSQVTNPAPVPVALASPMVFAVMQAGALAATIAALTGVGRMLGGKAGVQDIAILLIWMQALRVLAQAGLLVLIPLVPMLGAVAFMAITGLGIWILLNFLDEAHELGGLWKAGLVMGLGLLAMAFALSILLTLAGVDPNGMTGYV